jgi:FkbM family methyltransferase
MGIKNVLIKVLGEKRYLSVLAFSFPRLYRLRLLGDEYNDIYFLQKFVRPGDYCVDIGAHLGYFSLPLSRLVGPEGKVYAVEPMPAYHDTLQRLLKRHQAKNVTLYQVALGGDGEYVEMAIPDHGRTIHFARARVVAAHPDLAFRESLRVKNETGDHLFSGLPRLDFIKCDVEGLEYRVFASMTKTIETHRPILLCEVFEREMRIRLFELLKPYGYQPYVLEGDKLAPIDIYAEGPVPSQNDYFIPQQQMERLKPFIKA